jgi:ubiquinone/menaquinone biosynthesis methyltransferase
LFDTIAPRYDRFTRWFSFGMDARWKRALARRARAGLPRGGRILDLACGTGDLAACCLHDHGEVTQVSELALGLDVSRDMLAIAARRLSAGDRRAVLINGDMMSLPVASSSIDLVMVGYGMRNVPVLAEALAEIRRVLKPAGWLFTLDFFRPGGRAWRAAFERYLRIAGRVYGWWWHGEPDAYGYIAASLERWLDRQAYEDRLQESGFRVGWRRCRLGGGICLHGATKRGEADGL